ncbi:hypothetical protein QRO11_07115 [Paracidovorax citrulli]|uniref:hypothetical protein n=1 Tax=Paracidovorax citrulli TaxID=80869 RepID=UPI0005FAE943|nr:hypothetical protein [Paracidovorax citrulli]QCX09430.1 hypothetical protein APS58_0476 [Paracidovorax citrulli]UEG47588.1 hypothetical protein LKW27_06910 [Paracidovorax citrulli]UMT89157.1 hypothetical protein FRC90_14505 [Paracidovorax citrulli]UMT96125.1 hypothetical protein FRC97_14575 [Paracidovorax citrulli]WIY36094.1 hypothetical protein QRO11_07115 [Paracidovorax citrulli]
MTDHPLQGMFGEKSLTKIAGIYDDKPPAEALAGRLLRLHGLRPGQVRLLGPQDARASRADLFGRALEPDQRGVFRTLPRSHLVTGLAGALAGVLFYAWLLRGSQPVVAGSPLQAFLAIVGIATAFGVLLGGLVSLRPDHVRLITQVRSALRDGHWAVVVHPTDPHQAQLARDLLDGSHPGKIVTAL